MLIFKTYFFIFDHFTWSRFESFLTHNKTSSPQSSSHMHVFFLPHPYTRTYICLSVDILSHGSVKNFTGVTFFINTYVCRNIKKYFLNKSCRYLKSEISLQWTVCFPQRHPSTPYKKVELIFAKGNKRIINRYLRILRYFTDDIFWHNPSIRLSRRKSWAHAVCKIQTLMVMSNLTSMSWTILLKRHLPKHVGL